MIVVVTALIVVRLDRLPVKGIKSLATCSLRSRIASLSSLSFVGFGTVASSRVVFVCLRVVVVDGGGGCDRMQSFRSMSHGNKYYRIFGYSRAKITVK